jgi:hypothetical protein
MSTSESESESNLSNGDMGEDGLDDTTNGMYDDHDDDDFCDFDDTYRLTSLWDSIIEETAPSLLDVPSVPIPPNYSVHLAMNSKPHPSINSSSSVPFVDDSLGMYLIAPPLIRKKGNTGKHCLSIDPTIDESKSNSLSTSQLFVGNIPYDAKGFELRNWFIGLGYGVSRVELKTNKVQISL